VFIARASRARNIVPTRILAWKGLGDSKRVEFHQRSKVAGNTVEAVCESALTTLETANHPTDDDRDDDAQDQKPETGSNSVPPKRITNQELSTPPIDHNGPIGNFFAKLYKTLSALNRMYTSRTRRALGEQFVLRIGKNE
jgi:hypothetical protein